jgi:methionine biosynthesis protein MetW
MKSNQVIINWVNKDTSILDLGCGDGSILEILSLEKNVKGLGVEIDPKNIQSCIDKGINVIEQNIDEGITNFKSKSYDYVLLSETIQVLKNPEQALLEITRIGKSSIVAFPNFAHWKSRLGLFFLGRMPKTNALPQEWYNTKNIHLCTIKDFESLCEKLEISIDKKTVINSNKESFLFKNIFPNFFGELITYQVSRKI